VGISKIKAVKTSLTRQIDAHLDLHKEGETNDEVILRALKFYKQSASSSRIGRRDVTPDELEKIKSALVYKTYDR
jgi:hypothetical protein